MILYIFIFDAHMSILRKALCLSRLRQLFIEQFLGVRPDPLTISLRESKQRR